LKLGVHGIKKCPTIIYHLKKYRDTSILRYFVTSSVMDSVCRNALCESSAVLSLKRGGLLSHYAKNQQTDLGVAGVAVGHASTSVSK